MVNAIRRMTDLELDQIKQRVCRREPSYEDVIALMEEDGTADVELLVAIQKESERRSSKNKPPADYVELQTRYIRNLTNYNRQQEET